MRGRFALRGEDGLRRATFPNSWKSSQKSRKKPMVSSLPCALRRVKNCNHLPHVHVKFPFSSGQKNRLCSCAAAADRHGEGHYASVVRAVEDARPYTLSIVPSPPTFSVLSNTRTPFHSPLQSRLYAMTVMQRRISRPPVPDVMQAEIGAILTGLFLHITSLDTVRCLYRRIVHHLVYTVNKEECLCINVSAICVKTPT